MEKIVGQKLQKVEVLSLDVFDTSIHRRFREPVDIFLAVRHKLLHSAFASRYPQLCYDFPFYRQQAEDKAREISFEECGSPEATLDDIYRTLSQMLGIDSEVANVVKELEIAEEKRAIYADPMILALYNKARSLGKSVAFCSDTYFSSAVLRDFLRQCGYVAEEPILASCELKKAKWDGTMFAELVKTVGVPAKKILHIGDNFQADVKMARRYGLQALHWTKKKKLLEELQTERRDVLTTDYCSKTASHLTTGLIIKSRLVSESKTDRLHCDGNKATDECLRKIGYEIYGPLICGWVVWLLTQLHTIRPDKVLFIARDTFIIHQIFEKMKRKLECDIPSEYVFISRASFLFPSFLDLDFERLWFLIGGRSSRKVRDWLENLGIPTRVIAAAAARMGLSMEEYVKGGDHRLYELLRREFRVLLMSAKERNLLSKRYLETIVGNARRIVLVDVGWNGNIQGSFARLAADLEIAVDGLYLALIRPVPPIPGNTARGWLVHNGQPEQYRDALINGGIDLIEFALTAPHPGVMGYKEVNNRVEPVYEVIDDISAEKEYLRGGELIREGIMSFVAEALETLSVTAGNAQALNTTSWALPFLRFVTEPLPHEVKPFLRYTHSDSLGTSRIRVPLVRKMSFWERLVPGAVRKAREQVCWKAGFDVINRFWLA